MSDPRKSHDSSGVWLLTRRDFLWSAAVPLATRGQAPTVPRLTKAPTIRLSRPDDLLEFTLSLVNVELIEVGVFSKSLALRPSGEGARIAVELTPQHLEEEVVGEDRTGQFLLPKRGDLRAMFAEPTRLVVGWPQGLKQTPVSVDTILELLTRGTPLFPPATRGEPTDQSAIELIRNVLFTPAKTKLAKLRVVRGTARNGVRPVAAVAIEGPLAIRPIWTRDFDAAGACRTTEPDCPMCRTALTPSDRCEIVGVFSGAAPTPSTSVIPEPALADPLLMSSQGSFVTLHAGWEPPPGCGLQAWTQSIAQGRDHFVEIVEKYFVYPDGIPLTVVWQSARHFEAGDNGEGSGAFLKKRLIVRPTQTSRRTGPTAEMPWIEQVIPEQELPPLDLNEMADAPANAGWVLQPTDATGAQCTVPNGPTAFWPLVRGKKLTLLVRATDHDGTVHEMQRAFILVSNNCLESNGRLSTARQGTVDAAWEAGASAGDRVAGLQSRRIAVARSSSTSNTTLAVTSIDFARARPEDLAPGAVAPFPFDPRVHRMAVVSDALRALANNNRALLTSYRTVSGLSPSEARARTDGILTGDEIARAAGQAFLACEEAEPTAFKGLPGTTVKQFGGFCRPDIKIGGFGRDTELVPGRLTNRANLKPADLFAEGATLLGGVTLSAILGDDLRLDELPAWTFTQTDQNPWSNIALSDEVLQELRDSPQDAPEAAEPDASGWTASFDWTTTKLKRALLFEPFPTGCSLSVQARAVFKLRDGKAMWQSSARLAKFNLAIPAAPSADAWLTISFDEFVYSMSSDSSPTFSPEISGVRLGGKLAFLNDLQQLLHPENGLRIELTDSAISIRQHSRVGDQQYGVYSFSGLSFDYGLVLPLDGRPVAAEFSIARFDNPFTLSVTGYSGAGFFQTEVNASGPKSLAVSLEFGGDFSASFGPASGRAFMRAGFYFRKDDKKAEFRGFVRTGGHLDIAHIASVTMLAVLTLGCDGTSAYGTVHVEVSISIGIFSISIGFDVTQTFGSVSQPAFAARRPPASLGSVPPLRSLTDRMTLDEWETFWKSFAA